MEKVEVEKVFHGLDEGGQLNRSRSLKTKQLVRSQAIRESQSPPRSCSPVPLSPESRKGITKLNERSTNGSGDVSDTSSHASDVSNCDRRDNDKKKQSVEIQITHGAWESDQHLEQRQRAQRWLGHRDTSEGSRDLLSNNPRVACVCGYCGACPHCRGRRRKPICPTKQDSGIVCSDECPDCSDSEQTGIPKDVTKKSISLDVDDVHYCRCPERKEKPKTITLTSRSDSDDKLEPTGPELVEFIKETLNKNSRDRLTLLKIEKELYNLVNDTGRCIVRFPVMTSYGRMLVHRCASLFQLSHHLDQSNKTSVMVSKTGTSGGRIPCTSFKDWCTVTFPCSPQHHRDDTLAKSILKRSTAGGEESGGAAGGGARSKSLEQREREYERVRRRIFSSDNCTQDESQWPWLGAGPVKLLTSEGRKLLKVQSLESRGCEPQPRVRGVVSKSHSFGGYTADPPNHRLLSKQGDLASSSWRLSPSSSGYKTLSLRSTDSVTPSPTGGASPEPGLESGTLVWAVTDLSSVPPGALVIHPQTGRPLTNPDGSLYHFDPANPPIIHETGVFLQNDPSKTDPNNDKKRGRLEKQHSFMGNECECQPAEDCRVKCFCECPHQESCSKNTSDKAPNQQEEKVNSIPPSPIKTRIEQNPISANNTDSLSNNSQHEQTKPSQTNTQYEEPERKEQIRVTEPAPTYELSEQKDYESTDNQIIYDNQRHYDPNQRQYEAPTHHKPYENQYGSPSHRTPSLEQQKAFESANQRSNDAMAHRLMNKSAADGQDMTQYIAHANYVHGYRNDEVTSPPQVIPNPAYTHPDMANLHNMMLQTKVTPVPISDPNIRPLSLTNVIYPTPMPQGFSYVNPCRMDAPMQPIYQQMIPQQTEEPKQLPTSPHNNDTTFRIDPSYPYAADFSAACGACVGSCDPVALQHQSRGYNVAYGPMEMPQYPVGNVLLPQQIPHYPVGQYPEAVQWPVQSVAPPKLLVQELYPVMYPNMYPPYNVVYPPVIQQSYPLCQPVYPVIEKQAEFPRRNSVTSNNRISKHNSVTGSARNTPDEKPQFDDKAACREPATSATNRDANRNLSRQNSNEIAVKIQQIKEQMAQINTRGRDTDRGYKRDEWKRRNSGSGILGNYPINNHFNGRVMGRTPNEEAQLSTAARAIVNSIRSMQARTNYHHDNRRTYEYAPQYNRQDTRHDQQYRNRQRQERIELDNKTTDKPVNNFNPKRTGDGSEPKNEGDRRFDGMHRTRNINPLPFQYRPPYLFRQMSPGAWCRRSPGPVHPVLGHPRRPHPDTRNGRR